MPQKSYLVKPVLETTCIKRLLALRDHCIDITVLLKSSPRPGGSMVSVSDSLPGACEFDPRLRRLFFPAYFRLLPLQKHVRKVVGGFGKKKMCFTGVRKQKKTHMRHRPQ